MNEYVRTNGGAKVHRADGCWWSRQAKTAVPWRWANGKTIDQVVADMPLHVGVSLCGHCFDLGDQRLWDALT